MSTLNELQPHALIALSKSVPARILVGGEVPSSTYYHCLLPINFHLRVSWTFRHGDEELNGFAAREEDHLILYEAVEEVNELAHTGYVIKIQWKDLDGAFKIVENRIWEPEDMDLGNTEHWRLIIRNLPFEQAWMNVLPEKLKRIAVPALENLRSGLITNTEFTNEVLGAMEADRDTPNMRIEP